MLTAAPSLFDSFTALSDATRCRLLALIEHHELTVSELCAVLQLPQSTVSRHLKLLADAGWVSSRRDGTSRYYALALDGAGIPDDERLRSTLVDWFAWSNRVVNHTYERPELVPDDLTLPHWSWEGPVE